MSQSPRSRAVENGRRAYISLILVAVCAAVGGSTARGEPPSKPRSGLKVIGEGKEQRLDRDQFSPSSRPRYDLFATRCTKCHAMSRPIAALQTGVTPVSGGTFDDAGIKKYVVKMMRKPNSGLGKEDAKEILVFLREARKLAEGGR